MSDALDDRREQERAQVVAEIDALDEELVQAQAARCRRGDHLPEQVEVLPEKSGPAIYVWKCEACGLALYEVPDA